MAAKPAPNEKRADRPSFLSDIQSIRKRAREKIEDGAVTPSYGADRKVILDLLNEALATEIVCTLRYRRHYFTAEGAVGEAIKQEFMVHAKEEQGHADQIAERIVQLGGKPDFNPDSLSRRSHAEYGEGESLSEMLEQDLVAERVAIESYTEMIAFIGGGDPTTRRMLEEILAAEEEHAEEVSSMLKHMRRKS